MSDVHSQAETPKRLAALRNTLDTTNEDSAAEERTDEDDY